MKIYNHKLTGENISWIESPNQGGLLAGGQPDSIIIHYTAGSSAQSSIKVLCSPDYEVSAHLVVGRDGSITQLVPFDTVAWHAGTSRWKGRSGYNKYSIGIEIDNAGCLTKTVDGKYSSWFNKKYAAADVIEAVHRNETTSRFWHRYTEKQVNAVIELCQILAKTYHIKEILGHEEINPTGKQDPGPAFPLDKLRTLILDSRKSEADLETNKPKTARVKAAKLNIRSGPAPAFEKVADPLLEGEVVEVIKHVEDWVKVKKVTTGWVSGKYLEEG